MNVIAIKQPMTASIEKPKGEIWLEMLTRPDRYLNMVPGRKDRQWKESKWTAALHTNKDLASVLYLDNGLKINIHTNDQCQLLCEYLPITEDEQNQINEL